MSIYSAVGNVTSLPTFGGGEVDPESLLFAVYQSATITRHVEFYNWLQGEFQQLLPHSSLLTVWGHFDDNELNYDVTSNNAALRTKALMQESAPHPFLAQLYERTLASEDGWVVVNDIEVFALNGSAGTFFGKLSRGMKSLLAYRIRDERGLNDCLYIFFSTRNLALVNPRVCMFLMPHIDTALRRIKSFREMKDTDAMVSFNMEELSKREHDVMNWVALGKSNYEIGSTLKISHNTVKNHLKRVFFKLGVSSRAEAVRMYLNADTSTK